MSDLARLLAGLRPDELALRDWVRTRLNASIIREIAALDYGTRADEHRRGIEGILVARRLPDELPWVPGEVLQLCSYHTIDERHPAVASAGWRAHVARLFSCLVLTRTGDTVFPAGPLAGLVESALDLGPEPTALAVRYLAWCRLHEPGAWSDDEVRPLLTLGLLLAYAMTPEPRDAGVDEGLRAAFTDETRAAVPVEHWWADGTPTAGLRDITGAEAWRALRALVDRCAPRPDPLLRAWFRVE